MSSLAYSLEHVTGTTLREGLDGGRELEGVCSKTDEVFHYDASLMRVPQKEVYKLCTMENIKREIRGSRS